MLDIKEKIVTVIGAKRSGMALVKLITRLGGRAKLTDLGSDEHFSNEFKNFLQREKIPVELNGHTPEFIQNSDLVVLSPGVVLHSPPVLWAKEKGIAVIGEIEFAAEFCPVPIIAVTGSNGKTTTVTLIHEVLQEAGYRSCLCGNIGLPFSECVLDLKDKDYVVLEVSSFQLEVVLDPEGAFRKTPGKSEIRLSGFKPHVAVVLNFSQNHLNRHKDMEEYFQAKCRIFINQDKHQFSVLNFKDPQTQNLKQTIRSQLHCFDGPADAEKYYAADPNQLAVIEVARILNVELSVCRRIFERFKGVEHRLEKVRELDGVQYINDSKSTTIEAGRWALNSMRQPIIMIAGGKDKNLDFSVLVPLVKEKVKKMILIGEARMKIREVFSGVVSLDEAGSLKDAVAKACELAQAGDCVLLSPMCASFDMFDDYEHRGKCFKEIVHQLSPQIKLHQ
jgi:UDP-N-acetylmuramoylalanine--D-glutamate ligase